MPFYDLVMTFDVAKKGTPRLNGAGDIAVDAVTAHLESLERSTSPQRQLDYLYSVAVSAVIGGGAKPVGLSLRAFEQLCNNRFERVGSAYYA